MNLARDWKRGRDWALALGLGIFLGAGAAQSAELRRGDVVDIRADEVIQDDLYIFGRDVKIHGSVNGDLVVFARSVEMAGAVRGDFVVAAQTVRVLKSVQGSVRIAAQDIAVNAELAGDLIAATATLKLASSSRVARDLWVAGSAINVEGPVGGEIRAASEALTLGNAVGGDVRASVARLQLTDAARIGGTLEYHSDREAKIAPGATVQERIVSDIERRSPGQVVLFILWFWVRAIIGLTALGLLLAMISPRFARLAPLTIRDAPWKALGWGAAAFVAVPLVITAIFFLGAIFGGWWIGLLALAAYGIALALCFPIVGLYVGELILRRFGETGGRLAVALLVGVALLSLAGAVPILGVLVAIATVLVGLGTMLLTGLRLRREAPAA